MTKPKTFIQVNIYDRTILDLEREGIELKSMLNNIGCSKVWIVEGSLCEDNEDGAEQKEDLIVVDGGGFVNPEILEEDLVEKENESETKFAPLPVLSNTIANVKIPRCSTKVVSLKEPRDCCFTFNMTENISRIDSKCVSNDDFDASRSLYEVENVLSELVQKVVDTENEPPNRVPLPIFSVTVGQARIPRSSTPIVSQTELFRKFTLNIPEMLSNIESMDEDGTITEMQTEDDAEAAMEAAEEQDNDVTKTMLTENRASKMSFSLRATGSRGRYQDINESASNIKRSLSVISFAQSEACEEAGPEAKRILRPIKLEEVPERKIDYVFESDNNMNHTPTADAHNGTRQPSERVYQELRTIKSAEYADTYAFHSAESSFDLNDSEREESHHAAMHIDDYGGDDFFDYDGDREETMLIDHYEEVGEDIGEVRDDDMEREEDEEVEGDDKQDGDGDESVDNVLATKRVSFARPLTPRINTKKAEMNKVHIIKCHFDKCTKVFNWNVRYGKQRLLDHVMTHVTDSCLACRTCDAQFNTSRQMRYHYRKAHPEVKCNNFNILQVFNLELDDGAVSDLFDNCFGAHSAVLGKIGKIRNTRTKRPKNESKDGEEEKKEKKEDADKDTPGTSGSSNQLFYFRRIR